MRLTAYHDANGNILGLAASPNDDSTPAEVSATRQPGLRMTEITAPDGMGFDFSDLSRLSRALDQIVEEYRIDGASLQRKS